MPTYDYKCEACENAFEESLKIVDRDAPTEQPCVHCGGKVIQQIGVPLFAYDNIKTKHSHKPKEVDQLKDRLTEIKKKHPHGNL